MLTVAPVAVEKRNFNALYVPHLLKDQHEGLGKIQEDLKLSLVLNFFFFLNVKLYQLHALLPGLLKRRLLFAHVPVATVLFSAALQHTFVNSVLVLHALTLCVWLLFIRSGSEWTEANLHIKRLRKINDAKTKFWVFFAAGRLKKTDLISALIRWCLWNALPG